MVLMILRPPGVPVADEGPIRFLYKKRRHVGEHLLSLLRFVCGLGVRVKSALSIVHHNARSRYSNHAPKRSPERLGQRHKISLPVHDGHLRGVRLMFSLAALFWVNFLSPLDPARDIPGLPSE